MTAWVGEYLQQIGHVKLVGNECSEGFIIVDLSQSIVWANSAALDMHEVESIAELGETIDDYHARFQVKYVAVLPDTAAASQEPRGASCGRAQPEVLMEMKPQREGASHSLLRTRKMVLLDENARPHCIVFIMRQANPQAGENAQASGLLALFSSPAALLRQDDESLVATNAAYVAMAADSGSRCPLRQEAAWETAVEIEGQRYILLHFHAADQAVATGQTLAQKPAPATAGLSIIEAVPAHVLDDEMRIVSVNQAWLDWLGQTGEYVTGRKIFEFMPESAAERFERIVQAQLAQGDKLREVPAEFITRNGKVVHAQVSASVVPDPAGERMLLLSICVDVTAHRRLEDALPVMLALAPVPMLLRKRDDGRIIDANDAFVKATGHGVTDVVGHGFDEFANFESSKQRMGFEAGLRQSGRCDAIDVSLKTADGATLDCVMFGVEIWMFNQPCVLLMLQDVSERRRTEAELMSALDSVIKESSWLSRSVVERLAALRTPPKSGRKAAALQDLTPRERDVLSLISLGLPDAEIAERLGLTRSTIRNHLSTLYSKISVKNRGSAIIWARERCINITQLPLRPKTVEPKFGPSGPPPKQVAPFSQGSRV